MAMTTSRSDGALTAISSVMATRASPAMCGAPSEPRSRPFFASGPRVQHVLDQPHRLAQLAQAALVDGVAVQQVLAQYVGGPDAELRAASRADAIAHGEDRIEVVVLDLVSLAVGGSCCKKCNN